MRSICVAVAALGASALVAQAGVFSFSSGTRAASVSFLKDGTNLKVRLTNTSASDVLVPVDILTGVFFSVDGPALSLTRVSAKLAPGSIVTNGLSPAGGVVGGEWAYKATSLPGGHKYGISSSGLGFFGPGDRFAGDNLEGPADPDGPQFGIASAGDNPATHNGGANVGLIQNSVDFVLSGLPDGFNLDRITAVRFQYGTATDEPSFDVPTPGALALLGLGGLVTMRRRR